jgi:cytochrome c biogenesis protein CcdA
MNENRIMRQVTAIFSIFLVVLYLGAGIYFVFFSDRSYLDKSVRVIAGIAFIFYGLYRAYRTYVNIVEVFFTRNNNNQE